MPVEGIFWKCFVETSAKRTRTKSMPRGYRSVLIQGRFNTEIRILSLCDQSVKDQPDLIKKIIISQIKRQISDVRELRVDHRYSHTEAWAIVNEVRTLPYCMDLVSFGFSDGERTSVDTDRSPRRITNFTQWFSLVRPLRSTVPVRQYRFRTVDQCRYVGSEWL